MIKIGDREIGLTRPPYYIADIAANHNGDIHKAYKLIELAKKSGAHAAKFQNFTADKIISTVGFNEIGQVSHQSKWEKPVFEVYADASLPAEWSPLLKAKCDEIGIEYMTAPYDMDNVDLADRYVRAFKIGSGDITWPEILSRVASKGKPVLLATGASMMEDVRRAVGFFDRKNLVIMQCNTNYTASQDNLRYINLNVLKAYAAEFPEAVLGLSDHTHGYAAAAGAVALGGRVIEKHFTDDRRQSGPDHAFSMTPGDFREMADVCDDVFNALGDGIKRVEENEKETALIQRRGLYYARDCGAGETLSASDVQALRPVLEDGVAPCEDTEGRVLSRGAAKGTPVRQGDFL